MSGLRDQFYRRHHEQTSQESRAQLAPTEKSRAQLAPTEKSRAQLAPTEKSRAQLAPTEKSRAQLAPTVEGLAEAHRKAIVPPLTLRANSASPSLPFSSVFGQSHCRDAVR